MKLTIIDSGKAPAEKNMAIDQQLLMSLDCHSQPLLHFYDWQGPSATFGYFCSPSTLLNAAGIRKHALQLAKRPTGGGIIFHQFDYAFSFLLPAPHPLFSLNTLDNYRLVNQIIAETIQSFLASDQPLELLPCDPLCSKQEDAHLKQLRNFCMATPTVYDVVQAGRKLAGGAQRRTKLGFLHQASIALTLAPEDFLTEVLLPESGIGAAMKKCSRPLLGKGCTTKEYESAKKALQSRLIEKFSVRLQ